MTGSNGSVSSNRSTVGLIILYSNLVQVRVDSSELFADGGLLSDAVFKLFEVSNGERHSLKWLANFMRHAHR